MSLILKIPSLTTLDNGLPARLQLNERGAIIGRSPTVSWCLPDPSSQISSRHCEISFREGRYVLTDTSTNGTFVNGAQIAAPHTLRTGDVLAIGHYQIAVELEGEATAGGASEPQPSATPAAWTSWDPPAPAVATTADAWGTPSAPAAASASPPPPAPVAPAASSGWGAPAAPEADPWGSPATPAQAADPWGTPQSSPAAPAPSSSSPWDVAPPPPPPPSSPWSSAAPDVPSAPSTDDIWGKMAEGYVVDWARGGFGEAAPKPAADPLGLNPVARPEFTSEPVKPVAFAPAPMAAPAPAAPRTQVPAAQPAAPAPANADSSEAMAQFLDQLGIPAALLKSSDAETLAAAGLLLRRLVAGMVVMLEARARAKSQMGAQGTALQFDGNNPMKFARTPEQAIAQLLNPPERGFMSAERAIEDAFLDLQSHQMATLRAMQGALKATLDRFSPAAIRERAETGGLMGKIFKDSREAALWKAYEKEFGGVVHGSDEAFMDVFSREFRKAYDELTVRKAP